MMRSLRAERDEALADAAHYRAENVMLRERMHRWELDRVADEGEDD